MTLASFSERRRAMISELSFALLLIAFFVMLARRGSQRHLQERMASLETAVIDIDRQLRELRAGQPPQPRSGASPTGPVDAPVAAPQPRTAEPAAPIPPPRPASVPPIAAQLPLPPTPPPTGPSLEERLGAHWAVYAGGLALALGGIFLVRYSIEAGLLGPAVRVAFGALLAAALLILAEWLRRSERAIGIAQLPAAHIPSVLTAAGTAVAFGTVYAAHALYGFIGPAVAFVLLGAVGIGGMLAALLHGPALAGLGLAGSYVTPLLVSSDSPAPWPLVLYLLVVALSALLLARARRWLWLAATAMAGSLGWGVLLLMQSNGTHEPWMTAVIVHAGLLMALTAAFMGLEPNLGTADDAARTDWIATAALAAATWLVLLVLSSAPFAHALWMPFAVVMIALLAVTGWLAAPAAAAAVLAGAIVLGVLLMWPGVNAPPPESLLSPVVAGVLRLPENTYAYLVSIGLLTLPVAAIAAMRLERGPRLPISTAGFYALAAAVVPLLALVLVYLRVTQFDRSLYFGGAGIVLALAFALWAERFHSREQAATEGLDTPIPAWRLASGALAAASIAALSFSLTTSLDRGYLTVAFALAALGTAYVSTVREIPLLRLAVVGLGLVVLGRIVWDPRIMGDDVGRLAIFNWLLVGYGVPAVAFALAARLLRWRGEDTAVRLSDGLAVLFAGLLAFFEIHHTMAGGNLARPITGHLEQGLYAITGLGFTHVLTRLDLRRRNVVLYWASLVFTGLSGLVVVLGLGLFYNPLLVHWMTSGQATFGSLLLAYLLPGLGALYVARTSRGIRPEWLVRLAGTAGIALVFAWVTLEVRWAFHGHDLYYWTAGASQPERWSYTAAWLVLAVLFLAYGFWRGSLEARIASAVLIAVVSLKVVLVDLAGVSGLWRALSFLCLGAVLIGIGLVYQKLVFTAPRGGAGPVSPPASG